MSVLDRDMSDADFQNFISAARDLAGIELNESKRHLVVSRLIRRVKELDLPNLGEYRRYLSDHMASERENFVNAITTNLTSFFRESHHFDYLRDWVKHEHKGPVRIWSSASSTGQEIYSAAITLEEVNALERASLLGTDIDTRCVANAKSGVYPVSEIENLDSVRRKRHFLKGTGQNAGKVRVKPHLYANTEFSQLNLMDSWPSEMKFEVVFCRNVFIYFDEETQRSLMRRFAQVLVPGGILFLGHSESYKDNEGLFAMDGRTTYRRSQA
ncbi:MAG: CheR family methyltransferase [Pseudomonadota bacterium]